MRKLTFVVTLTVGYIAGRLSQRGKAWRQQLGIVLGDTRRPYHEPTSENMG